MKTGLVACVFLMLCCLSLPCFAGITYSNILSSADGTILGTGNWVASGSDPTTLSYTVYQNPNQTWHYEYLFSSPPGDLSHLNIEMSANITGGDIFNASGGDLSIGLWEPGPSNPNMLGSLFGAKFDVEGDNPFAISFDSTREPMWADFYAKDGAAFVATVAPEEQRFNACWNSGFTNPDFDPVVPYTVFVGDHILAPDTTSSVVPVPGGIVLAMIGLPFVGWLRRRRSGA